MAVAQTAMIGGLNIVIILLGLSFVKINQTLSHTKEQRTVRHPIIIRKLRSLLTDKFRIVSKCSHDHIFWMLSCPEVYSIEKAKM
jgi:hypothetical protein